MLLGVVVAAILPSFMLREVSGANTTSPPSYPDCSNPGLSTLRGCRVNVSVFGVSPYVTYAPDGSLGGVDVDLLDALAGVLGFAYDLVREPSWVVFDRNMDLVGGTLFSVREN